MSTIVNTEMPGSVWKILVAPGAPVEVDDVLFILEVMKTEVAHHAPVRGIVRAVLVSEGEFVAGGAPAIEIGENP